MRRELETEAEFALVKQSWRIASCLLGKSKSLPVSLERPWDPQLPEKSFQGREWTRWQPRDKSDEELPFDSQNWVVLLEDGRLLDEFQPLCWA